MQVSDIIPAPAYNKIEEQKNTNALFIIILDPLYRSEATFTEVRFN